MLTPTDTARLEAIRERGPAQEYRVVWKRAGLRRKVKRFATRRAAERLLIRLTDPEPWRTYLREGQDPDDYRCCSGHECGCGGITYRQEAEDMRANQPPLESVQLEARRIEPWTLVARLTLEP